MSQYDANNPIQQLMDVEVPEIKRANWNCDHSVITTGSPLFVNCVFSDIILPNTRVKLDIDQASFANPTISPLYGRFKVKYLAYFAPHRLYMKEWRLNETTAFATLAGNNNNIETPDNNSSYVYPIAGIPDGGINTDNLYIPPTSLGEQLGLYPAYFQATDWNINDKPDPSVAFPFLAYWDFFRYYIANQQDGNFYVRTRAFKPAYYNTGGNPEPSVPALDHTLSRQDLDKFFSKIASSPTVSGLAVDVCSIWESVFGYNPLFVPKDDAEGSIGSEDISRFVRHEFHYGLPIAPFSADPFTSWIDNSSVSLERTQSKMIVNNGALTMDQWRIANATQTKLRKYLFNLGDFGDMVDSQYGIKPSTQISKPMFLGAFVSSLVFNDVVSTAQTGDDGIVDSNTVLGSRAGYGRGTDRGKQNFIDFTAQEFGTLQIVQIIEPEVFYYEGRDLQLSTHAYSDEFNPVYNIGLLQDLQKQQLNLVPGLTGNPTGVGRGSGHSFSTYNYSIGKQPYGMEHITKTNRLKGMMTMPEYYQGWSLARSFTNIRNFSYGFQIDNRSLASTYGVPEMFTNIFANNQNIDNFQFYLSFNYTKYNVVLKKFIPFT